ncbi:MAG: TolC family protein [Acidobacteria bacterium]|nr:TolC family protein [Acidobacteriota bacterium]
MKRRIIFGRGPVRIWAALLITMVCVWSIRAQTTAPAGADPATGQVAAQIPRNLTLAQAEDLLLRRNLPVLAARHQIEAGRAARLIAGFKPNPVLTVGVEQVPFYSPLRGSFPRFFTTNSDAGANPTYTVQMDKLWERGGKRELRLAEADSRLKAAEAQMLDAIRTQLYQLRQAFTLAALARENLRLAETVQQQYEQTEKLTVAKVELGDMAGVEVYRIRAGLLQYQRDVVEARTEYEQAVRDVLNLLGARVEEIEAEPLEIVQQSPARAIPASLSVAGDRASTPSGPVNMEVRMESLRGAPLEVSFQFDDRPIVQTPAELRRMALAERPDVIAARMMFEAGEQGVSLARAQRVRDVNVGWQYQRAGSDHALGLVVSIPLFVYNNQRAGITQAESERNAAEALLRAVEAQAVTDVEKAYQAYVSTRRILELYSTQNLAQVTRLRDITAYTFQQGALSLFELLDAQRSYNQTLTAYNQARAGYQLALWQLEQAVGKPVR